MTDDGLSRTALRVFTPLRYPGGKAKLAPFVKKLITENQLFDTVYVEPFAGGAGLALELLLQDFVSHVFLNDISKAVWSFWHSVLTTPESLVRLVRDTPVTVDTWDRQKSILKKLNSSTLELGFALFFLNRTNRSGILNGGMIGGRAQTGKWKIDARYNKFELVRRIFAIANMADRITLSNEDAFAFLSRGLKVWPKNSLVYLDPPYYVKGRSLYLDCYTHKDHEQIAKLMLKSRHRQRWIISYDNVEQIREIYAGCNNSQYALNYSARDVYTGNEIMFFSPDLVMPDAIRAMKPSAAS